jgi:hypothetical protein
LEAALPSKQLSTADRNTLNQLAENLPAELHHLALRVARAVDGWVAEVDKVGSAVRCDVVACLLELRVPVPPKLAGRVAVTTDARQRARALLGASDRGPDVDPGPGERERAAGARVHGAPPIPFAEITTAQAATGPQQTDSAPAQPPSSSPRPVWDRTLARLRSGLHRNEWLTWFEPMSLAVSGDGKVCTLTHPSPSQFVAEWIEQRHASRVRTALAAELGYDDFTLLITASAASPDLVPNRAAPNGTQRDGGGG